MENEDIKVILAKARGLRELAAISPDGLKVNLIKKAESLILGRPTDIIIEEELSASIKDNDNAKRAGASKAEKALMNKESIKSFINKLGEKNIIGEALQEVYQIYECHCKDENMSCMPIEAFSKHIQSALNIKTVIRDKKRIFACRHSI